MMPVAFSLAETSNKQETSHCVRRVTGRYKIRNRNRVSAIFHFSLFTLHFSLKEQATVSAALPADFPR